MPGPSPAKQLDAFIAKFTPAVAAQARAALAKLRPRLRGAIELVYDNYNALAIAFSATEKVGDVVCSIALYPRWVSLFFMHGAELPDPHARLRGSGRGIRHVKLDGAATLDEPAVKALLAAARARGTIDPKQPSRIVVKSVSPKQRPRRPAAARPKAHGTRRAGRALR